jgi:hypothetical protein
MAEARSNRGLAVVYAGTIFVSAFLLFQIQPMVSKAILPWFGGTPAVWTICLLFFQTLLFAGYAYAHFTNAWLTPRRQAAVHIIVIIAALAMLRVVPDARWQPLGEADPTRAILIILAVTIGLPYFVLSATGPLLQAWFARSFPGRTPYRLYALSNVGSLLALLGYPFLFEREFDLPSQARLWQFGFIAFAVLCAYAAWRVRSAVPAPTERGLGEGTSEIAKSPSPPPSPEGSGSDPEPTTSHYLLWLILPAFASIVLMATTNHVSTDVAVVPLLWVVPLALYLLTFIIAFDRPAWYWPTLTAALTLVAIYPTSAMYKKNNVGELKLYDCGMTGRFIERYVEKFLGTESETDDGEIEVTYPEPQVAVGFRSALVLNFATMFGICMLCHGQLARLKPPTRYLTAYYLMISAGGALGGIAVSLIAPHVFKTIFEWRLAIFVAAVAAVGVILSELVSRAVDPDPESSKSKARVRAARILLIIFLLPASLVLLDLLEFLFTSHNAAYQSRNFFGALTISESNPDDLEERGLVLLNGTTLHGAQFTPGSRRTAPTSYYAHASGVGMVLDWFHQNRPPGGVRIGDVGLGAGTLAAYAMKFDHIVFYEINPTVLEISNSGKWFTYIADARNRGAYCDIKLGDARLSLQRELATDSASESGEGPPTKLAKGILPFHVLVLDAFSGDAVPTHLLTTEAMDIYRPHLATEANMGVEGALLIHVSNRYLNLDRVARGAANYLGYECVLIASRKNDEQAIETADWVVLTRNKALLAALAPHANSPERGEQLPVVWTDSHSSLFEILR